MEGSDVEVMLSDLPDPDLAIPHFGENLEHAGT